MGVWRDVFVNLARNHLRESGIPILEFNPWMFSGAEQLVESFFVELAAQLRVPHELAEIGKDLEDYGEAFSGLAWLPLVGPWIERGRTASASMASLATARRPCVPTTTGLGGSRTNCRGSPHPPSRPASGRHFGTVPGTGRLTARAAGSARKRP